MSNWNTQYASTWTEGSKFCYRRGCNCQGCYVKDIVETHCLMKHTVMELVKKFGAPPSDKKQLTPMQRRVVNAILSGAETLKEICKRTKLNKPCAQTHLVNLYRYSEEHGLVYENKNAKLKEFIEWIKEYDYDENI